MSQRRKVFSKVKVGVASSGDFVVVVLFEIQDNDYSIDGIWYTVDEQVYYAGSKHPSFDHESTLKDDVQYAARFSTEELAIERAKAVKAELTEKQKRSTIISFIDI